jgi:hypothetical protein
MSNKKTFLANIDFSAPTISYQDVMPTIGTIISAVFVSRSIYYVAVNSFNFYSDYSTNLFNLLYYHAIIYTSDMSLSSCY